MSETRIDKDYYDSSDYFEGKAAHLLDSNSKFQRYRLSDSAASTSYYRYSVPNPLHVILPRNMLRKRHSTGKNKIGANDHCEENHHKLYEKFLKTPAHDARITKSASQRRGLMLNADL